MALDQWRERQLLPVAGHQREPALDLGDEVLVIRRLAFEQQHRADVHVRAAVLQGEERGVKPAEAIQVGHPLIVAHRSARDRHRHTVPARRYARTLVRPPNRGTRCAAGRGTHLSGPGEALTGANLRRKPRSDAHRVQAPDPRRRSAMGPRARQLTSQASGSNAQGGLHETAKPRAPRCGGSALLRHHRSRRQTLRPPRPKPRRSPNRSRPGRRRRSACASASSTCARVAARWSRARSGRPSPACRLAAGRTRRSLAPIARDRTDSGALQTARARPAHGQRARARPRRVAPGVRSGKRALGRLNVYRTAYASWYGPGLYGNRSAAAARCKRAGSASRTSHCPAARW